MNETNNLKAFLCKKDQADFSDADLHYVVVFKNFDNGNYISWNWVAFFLNFINFAYIKNWMAFLISFLTGGLAVIILAFFLIICTILKFKQAKQKAELLSNDFNEQKNL
ncbi:MAG: DUF2628 domain-containing protein [Treponemataceae bacterium]